MNSIDSGCKVNLYLKITGRRADGYHTLDTVFWPLDTPGDHLEWHEDAAPGIRFVCPEMPECAGNLVLRAAKLYAERAGLSPAWEITLRKKVPVAAGLGGGSADAGAMLTMLEERFHALGETELVSCALALGADVPFFLKRRPLRAAGVGEVFSPLSGTLTLPPLVVVFPDFPVRAVWAYQVWHPAAGPDTPDQLIRGLQHGDAAEIAAGVRNDLGTALFEKFPLLVLLKRTMLEHGALTAEVSGSGPSLFGICADDAARDQVAGALRRQFAGIQLFCTEKRVVSC